MIAGILALAAILVIPTIVVLGILVLLGSVVAALADEAPHGGLLRRPSF